MLGRWQTMLAATTLAALTMFPMLAADPAPANYRDQAAAAIKRGGEKLLALQNEDGSWGRPAMVGITALCVIALRDAPQPNDPRWQAAIAKGMANLLTSLNPVPAEEKTAPANIAESFWVQPPRYANYTAAVLLIALAGDQRPELVPVLRRARAYLRSTQIDDPESPNFGGFGYGPGGGRADLSNAAWTAEALHLTEWVDHEPTTRDPELPKRNDAVWKALGSFLDKCQKLPSPNAPPAPAAAAAAQPGQPAGAPPAVAAADPDEGGFSYLPAQSPSAKLMTTGSMSYAGLKTMLYAKLSRDDARVKGALRYISRNYDLANDPSKGQSGYYYYLLAMGKALAALGQDQLTLADGRRVDWRADYVGSLLKQQHEDGSWSNEQGRFMESLPELVTSYALIGIEAALSGKPVPEPARK